MIRWDLGKKCLECWKTLEEPESVTVFSWKKNGTDAQAAECINNFQTFVRNYGVKAQWERQNAAADPQQMISLADIHWKVWVAATELWGNPTWEIVDLSKK